MEEFATEAVLPSGPPSVLMICESSSLTMVLGLGLQEHGMQVHSEESVASGMPSIESRAFDVVLLDVTADLRGFVLEQIKILRPHTPVIVLLSPNESAVGLGAKLADELLTKGAWAVVPKPLDLDDILFLCSKAVAIIRERPTATASSAMHTGFHSGPWLQPWMRNPFQLKDDRVGYDLSSRLASIETSLASLHQKFDAMERRQLEEQEVAQLFEELLGKTGEALVRTIEGIDTLLNERSKRMEAS